MKKDKILATSSFALISLLPVGESYFLIDNNLKIPTQIVPKGDEPVCYIGDTYYTSIEKALFVAKSNDVADTIYVIPGTETTICDDAEIHKLDTLCLPYEDEKFVNDFEKGDNSSGINDFADSSIENVNKYRTTRVKIKSGYKLTNYGTLIVGGYFGSANTKGILSHVSNKYTEIFLERNASIDSYGTIECYGYIKEENDAIEEQNIGNNNNVNILGGNLKIPFVIYDFTTLGGATTVIDSGVFPFQHYDFPNIQTTLNIYKGTTVSGSLRGSVTILGSKVDIEEWVSIVGNDTNSLFQVENGYMSLKYTSSLLGCTSKLLDSTGGSTIITGHGDLIFNHIYINLENQLEVDTATHPMPLTYRMKLTMSEGNLIINYPLKIMPGSFIKISKNAKLTVNSTLLFYPNSFSDDRKSYPYPSSLNDAFLELNGNLELSDSGKLGGLIKTSNSLSDTKIDFSNLTADNLSASMKDGGSGGIQILEHAKGYIASDDETSPELNNFLPNEQYYSYNQYWIGNVAQGYNLIVRIDGLNESEPLPENMAVNYTIEIADDSQGTNSKVVVLNSTSNLDTTIETGKYFRLISTFGKNIYAENHSEIIFDNESRNLCSDNLVIHIAPVEIVKPKIGYGGTGVNSSGIAFSIYASKTQEGVFNLYNGYKDLKGVGESGYQTLPIEKDIFIKIEYNNKWTSGETLTFKFDDINGTNFNNYKKHNNNNVYKVTNYFEIIVKQNYCFAKGTLILLAGGNYKKIEEISYNDEVMTWNFFTGKLERKKISIIVNHGKDEYEVLVLIFDNGKRLEIIGEHGAFNWDINKFVYINSFNVIDFINTKFVFLENGKFVTSKLVSFKLEKRITNSYSITSAHNFNVFSNELLTAPPPENLYNWISMDNKMHYNSEEFSEDILKYGLYDYSAFEAYGISYKTFLEFNGPYLKIPVEKGLFTFEYIIEQFNLYKDYFDS